MKHYNDEFYNQIIDGEVELNAKQEFLAHISKCPECSKEYSYYIKAHSEFQMLEVVEAPLSINKIILNQLVKVVKPSEGNKKFFITMLSLFTGMLLIIFGVAFHLQGSVDTKNQKSLFDVSKIDLTFVKDFFKLFESLSTFFTPQFSGFLVLLVISIFTYFFIERIKGIKGSK
jgi:hypothetical protein